MTGADPDFLSDVRKKYEKSANAESRNRERALDDIRFARLNEQWPETVKLEREADQRPCLVINRLPSFIRQVVNSARQNRPAITVIPADGGADKDTAEIMSGLIRNIEVTSDADIAYDTAVENAVSGGFGYFRINTAFTSDDSFDQDIVIERVADPFTVYGDPESESADGSDWNCAFVCRQISRETFADKYKGKDPVDWNALGYTGLGAPWVDGDMIMIAEYWKREEIESEIVALSNDTVVSLDAYREQADELEMMGVTVVGEPRAVRSHKVKQYIVSGAEVLEELDWPGKYIPIVPVYGDECVVEGERHFKSLITDAKDAQRELNYWRSAASESVALAPQAPFIGEEGAFAADIEKWSTANRKSHAFIQYAAGFNQPLRQPPPPSPAAEIQMAMASSDDMKAIIGLFDPSLGERSNETSGVAIRQRQRQGDIGTFHFIDNLTRSIRHAGRILIDLIPKVYSTARIIRVLGQDMEPQLAQIAPADEQQQVMQKAMERGQDIARIYDLTAGKYDLVVKAGPSFGTQREYAQAEIVEIIRAFPDAAPVLGPMYLRNSDWPGADEAADKLEAGQQGGDPGQAQAQAAQMQQAMQQLGQKLQQMEQENRELKQQWALKAEELRIKDKEADIKAEEIGIKRQAAQVDAVSAIVQANAARAGNPFAMEGPGQQPTP